MLRQERGFTLVELMVVLAVITIGPLIIAAFGGRHIDAYRFSNVVRTFNNSMNLARIRAVQTQQTTRMIVRPLSDVPTWQSGVSYSLGQIVAISGAAYAATYTCTQGHTASTSNKPQEGANWPTYWTFTVDFQYDGELCSVEHCIGSPLVCTNAYPFNASDPVRIEFNVRGFTANYIDHTFRIVGTDSTKAGQPGTLFVINPLGTITQKPAS